MKPLRIKPHGIKYYPDVVLDVIYDQPLLSINRSQATGLPSSSSSSLSRLGDREAQQSSSAATAAASDPPISGTLADASNDLELPTLADRDTPITMQQANAFLKQADAYFKHELDKQFEFMYEALSKPEVTLESLLANVSNHVIRRALEVRQAKMQEQAPSLSTPTSPLLRVANDKSPTTGEDLGHQESAKQKSVKQEFEMLQSRQELAKQTLEKIEQDKQTWAEEDNMLEKRTSLLLQMVLSQDERQRRALLQQHSQIEGQEKKPEQPTNGDPQSDESLQSFDSSRVEAEEAESSGRKETSQREKQGDDDNSSDDDVRGDDEEEAEMVQQLDLSKPGTSSTKAKNSDVKAQELEKIISVVSEEIVHAEAVHTDEEGSTEVKMETKQKGDSQLSKENTASSTLSNNNGNSNNIGSKGNKDHSVVKSEHASSPAPSPTPNSDGHHQHENGGAGTRQQCPFSFMDVVAHRGKEILNQRYDWLQSPCPKMFIMLPGDNELASVDDLTWQDFDLYFLCDCGDLPARGPVLDTACVNCSPRDNTCRCLPHVDMKDPGYPLFKEALAFGPYIMAILEMLEYGATIDGVVKMTPLKDLKERRRVMYSMVFLMKQGIETSHQLLAKGYTSLDEIKPIAPLKETELADLYRSRISVRRPFFNSYTFRTLDGDIRWLCKAHYDSHTSKAVKTAVPQFSNHPDSRQCTLNDNLGSLVVTLKTRERGRDFFCMVEEMVTTPVISFFLDWDLTDTDELMLEVWIPRLSATCVKIYVREREEQEEELIPGFGHRYYGIILAAIMNKNIQAFSIERRSPGDNNDTGDELFGYKGAVYLDPILARFAREPMSPKVQLGVLVTDLDKAAMAIRVGLKGFHMLSKLTLEATYWDHIDHIDIDFGENEAQEVEKDTDYQTESNIEFFNKRKYDAITVRTYLSADTQFLKTHALKDVNIRIAFPEDGPRIRELIKHNQRLKKMELSIECKDDPCVVFEYFKALTNNHPSLESFHLLKDWGKNNKSTFVWHGVSDRAKMTLSIMSHSEDKIGPLLQKFGACLLQLFIQSINATDAAILEKVTRSRKGQLKLVTIALVDIFTVSQIALDELAKVLQRTPLQRFQITGTVVPRTTSRVGEFMTSVASKITDIHFYGEHTKTVLAEMTKRMPESSGMDLLQELKISGPFDATTKDLTWIRSLLAKPTPLTTIELHKVNLSHQGWMTLAQEIDFKRLKYFRVGPDVPLKSEAIKAFVLAVPPKSELENFHLDSDGLKEGHCLAYKSILMPQLRKRTALVSIGRYF
ncbi:hypothetical protein BGX21_010009 [Mortierella sp. AD011]|nr:hypothetical protein BGX20_001038 [Mortierella sp. AD010]KAF9402467.1 hypothetical protein BGX21_010009 [Mortierella sp. AD011]